MLNKKQERELAYIVKIDGKNEIPGYDRIASYTVGGWHCVAGKNDFEVGDLAVYIEIDAMCPYTPVFSFLDKSMDEHTGRIRPDRHKIKTQKFAKGTMISQGLIVPIKDCDFHDEKKLGDFVTTELGITYYDPNDNIRKGMPQKTRTDLINQKTNKWVRKHPKLGKLSFVKTVVHWFYSISLKKKKNRNKTEWPKWVHKTDEERCQNLPGLFSEAPVHPWIATEKIDGTSTTFTMKQSLLHKYTLLVCSRNVVFNNDSKKSFYDDTEGNVYKEMAKKYQLFAVLSDILKRHKTLEYITFQGETYGGNIQKRNYGSEHRLAIFNIIYKNRGEEPVRLNPIEMTKVTDHYKLEAVPIVDTEFYIPATCDELLQQATGVSKIDGGMREGLVFRSCDGVRSFKAVSNEYLMKYHS